MTGLNRSTAPGPEERYLQRERLAAWFLALHSLPERSRQVVLLRDYHEFSYQEIAEILRLSPANVKVTLFRARQKIREVMRGEL